MTTTERSLLADLPITSALNGRDRTLRVGDPLSRADLVFRNTSVTVVPVVDPAGHYVGAIDRKVLAANQLAVEVQHVAVPDIVPTVRASTSAIDALEQLDAHGGKRLVVLEDDGVTYRGLVCLRADRERLCIESECHTTS